MPTFQQILASMIQWLQNAGSKLTDFTPTSIVGQILSAIASVIDQIYYAIQNAQNQANISTASGAGLDAKGADVGVPRKQATPARWYFTFIKNQASSQQITIPQGTIITTIPGPNQPPITFATDTNTYLPVGTLSVTVSATCQTPGSIGNIAPNTPLLVGSAVPGIDGVQLQSLANGTYGTDTETDDAYRQRLLAALASKAQGTLTWYQQTALSVVGVQSVKVVPQGRGPGTVDIYIVGIGNTLPSPALIGQVQSTIDAGRIITDDAKVFSPTPYTINQTINIKVAQGYDLTQTANQVQQAITNYINGLGIGGGSLGALYQAQVNAVALSVPGVVNILQPATPQPDITFNPFQLPQAGTVTVNASY
ncbi:tail protein [Collibacillus ludicampi]|uniref:Tail protein n=1 Tax=Collibacillus ludicampi TaxID=2771369 RepID=A0AAV4LGT7_9BACL|nr:baseplate J/gp47 family protein [Collibacillus ludicampi]GIM47046.1 tail protein [Collibacillus ludicampi]